MNFKRYSKQRNETLIVTICYAGVIAESICAELREKGLLSEEEFEKMKEDLLK